MGYTPRQVREMSLYEWAACIDGWNRSKSGELEPPTPEEFEAAKAAHGL